MLRQTSERAYRREAARWLSSKYIRPPAEPQLQKASGAGLIKHRGPSGPKQPQQELEYMGRNRAYNYLRGLEGEALKEKAKTFIDRSPLQAFRNIQPIDRNSIFPK